MNLSFRRMFFSELTVWLVVAAIGIYLLVPLRKSLRYGIDLVGGTYLTLEVQTDKAVEAELVERMQNIDGKLRRADRPIPTSKSVQKDSIILNFSSLQNAQDAATYLKGEMSEFTLTSEGNVVKLQLPERAIKHIKEDAVTRNIEVLRTRMRDIPIAAQGEKNIVIELPDTANPQEAKARIGKAAQLELKLVEQFKPTKEDVLYELDGELPMNKEILPGVDEEKGFYLVDKYAEVTGRMLKSAQPGYDDQYNSVVQFKLNDVGADKFYQLTSKHYGRRLAIVLDGVVISAPRINGPIPGGSGSISGNFTPDSARELAMLLQSGSFVAPVTFEEERQIGPTLGQESIHKGFISCLVGLLLLLLYGVFWYRLAGVLAFITLLYNLELVLLSVAWLQTPLTLPGIAGLVLTVGMAIDASILIFEHAREELSKGVTLHRAIFSGFSGARQVILDANITTFIVGIVLYHFGSGPVQGFAITMMLGIIATVVTGIFFLKALFKFIFSNFNIQKLRI